MAPVSGLTPIEITVLDVAASAADVTNSNFSLWSVHNDAEKAGLTRLAIGLAIRRLTLKQFIEEAWVEENGNEPYRGAAITGRGWDWIDANEEKFVLRRPQRESRKIDYSETGITDDDIPF